MPNSASTRAVSLSAFRSPATASSMILCPTKLDSHRTVGGRHARCCNPNQGRRADAGTAVWVILFFIACAVVYSVEKLIYQVSDLTVHVTHAAYRLIPVPSQRWHRTTLSPFLSVPFPSQFLHFCFFLPSLFCIGSSGSNERAWRKGRAKREASPA
jgi:hypothetical protein